MPACDRISTKQPRRDGDDSITGEGQTAALWMRGGSQKAGGIKAGALRANLRATCVSVNHISLQTWCIPQDRLQQLVLLGRKRVSRIL